MARRTHAFAAVALTAGLGFAPAAAPAQGLPSTIDFAKAAGPDSYRYVARAGPAGLEVSADVPYVTALRSGLPVAAIGQFSRDPFDYQSPRLAFKLSNTKKKASYFTTLTAANIKSSIDLTPIPVFRNGSSRIQIANEGWGPLIGVQLDYADRPAEDCHKRQLSNLVFRRKAVGRLEEHGAIDVVDAAMKAKYQTSACVVGILGYTDLTGVAYRVPFRTSLYWGPPLMGAGPPVTSSYLLALQAGKSGYSQSIEISEALASQEADQFYISFASDKSASFEFRARVEATDKSGIDLGNVRVRYFRPRSAYLRSSYSNFRTVAARSQLPEDVRDFVTAIAQLPAFMKPEWSEAEVIARTTTAWATAPSAKRSSVASELLQFIRDRPPRPKDFSLCMVDDHDQCDLRTGSDAN